MLSWYFVMDLIMLGIKPKTMRPFVIADHLFGLCNSTFHVMTLTAFFKYDAEENFDDHWAIAFTAAIIKFDQKCLLTLRSPFCYSPFVLYFYTTELNQGSSPNAKWFILSIKSPTWKASGCESCLTSLPLLIWPYFFLLGPFGYYGCPSGSYYVLLLVGPLLSR